MQTSMPRQQKFTTDAQTQLIVMSRKQIAFLESLSEKAYLD